MADRRQALAGKMETGIREGPPQYGMYNERPHPWWRAVVVGCGVRNETRVRGWGALPAAWAARLQQNVSAARLRWALPGSVCRPLFQVGTYIGSYHRVCGWV